MKTTLFILLLSSLTSFAGTTYKFVMADARYPQKPFTAEMTSADGITSFEDYLVKGKVVLHENGDPQVGVLIGLLDRHSPSTAHPWSFKFNPQDLFMADMTTEVCDAEFQYIEDNLEEWFRDVKNFCPWNTRSLIQQIFRNGKLIYSRR